jgi:hypothetical protein
MTEASEVNGVESESTSLDFAGDVLSGVTYLKSRKEVDPKRSDSSDTARGIIAPLVASLAPEEIAFIVMMAGTGLTGEEIVLLQGALIAKAEGASDEQIAKSHKTQETIFSVMKQEKDPDVAAARIRQLTKDMRDAMTEEEKKQMTPEVQEAQIKRLFTPWFRYFLTYDPKPALKKVRCPVLVLNGEKDLQVPPKDNLKAIEAALKAGQHGLYDQRTSGLNHLFQTAQTGSPMEYSKVEETISPSALAVMGDWILEKTDRKSRGGGTDED